MSSASFDKYMVSLPNDACFNDNKHSELVELCGLWL
jgi:hypothetical protein